MTKSEYANQMRLSCIRDAGEAVRAVEKCGGLLRVGRQAGEILSWIIECVTDAHEFHVAMQDHE